MRYFFLLLFLLFISCKEATLNSKVKSLLNGEYKNVECEISGGHLKLSFELPFEEAIALKRLILRHRLLIFKVYENFKDINSIEIVAKSLYEGKLRKEVGFYNLNDIKLITEAFKENPLLLSYSNYIIEELNPHLFGLLDYAYMKLKYKEVKAEDYKKTGFIYFINELAEECFLNSGNKQLELMKLFKGFMIAGSVNIERKDIDLLDYFIDHCK